MCPENSLSGPNYKVKSLARNFFRKYLADILYVMLFCQYSLLLGNGIELTQHKQQSNTNIKTTSE